MIKASPTPTLKGAAGMLLLECVVDERSPQTEITIWLSRSRKHCSSCRRKTVWLISNGGHQREGVPFRSRRCWEHMSPAERQAFREGY